MGGERGREGKQVPLCDPGKVRGIFGWMRKRVYMAKILIIDDNAMNRKLFRFLLKKAGYDVFEAENGRQGVERAKEIIPGLILMDIQMPDMDGIATLKAIREAEAAGKIPVIAITSYAMKGDRERFLSEGFVDYISKPIDNDVFLTSIKNALERYHG